LKVTHLALRRRSVVYVLVVLIVLLGSQAYRVLPREAAPDITIPVVLVTTAYPGVSPQDIEVLVTHPLERELKELRGIDEMRSTSAEGVSIVTLEFAPDVDIDTALQRIRDRVDRARPDLPSDAEDPVVTEISTEDFPVMILALSGEYGLVRLEQVADDLKRRIELVPGVLEVQLTGEVVREIHVYVDPDRMSVLGLTMDEVVRAVQNENVNMPGGTLDLGDASYLVRVPAEFRDPREIEDVVVKVEGGDPIQVRDFATVVDGFRDRASYARIDGRDAITLTISKRGGANLLVLADTVREIVDTQMPTWPAGTRVDVLSDQSEDIRDMVRQLENTMITGLILVVGVLFFALGLRTSLFVAAAIPLSMLITFFVLQALGITLNMIVLFSLILALGMLVDNAIVIVENIYRHMQQGTGRVEAAWRGTKEVAWPVTTSTLTTVGAFLPLLFWPGVVGTFMGFLPRTIIITLLASLFVALVVSPVLCASFMRADPKRRLGEDGIPDRPWAHAYQGLLRWALHRRKVGGFEGVLRNGIAPSAGLVVTFMLVRPLSATLGGAALVVAAAAGLIVFALVWALVMRDNRARLVYGMVYLLIGTAFTYAALDRGVVFFPQTTPDSARIVLRTPDGSRLEHTDAIARAVEAGLSTEPNVMTYVANIGGAAAAAGSVNVGQSVANQASINVDFLDEADRVESPVRTIEILRAKARALPGVEVEVLRPQMGPPTGAPVAVEIRGDDLRTLGALARQVRDRIADVPGLVDLKDDYQAARPEIRVEVDRVRARLAGVSTGAVASTIRTAISGNIASTFRDGADEYDIVVRLPPGARADADVLRRLTVPDEDGRSVPLSQVATLRTAGGSGSIRHLDGQRLITVSGDAEGRQPARIQEDVEKRLEDFPLPPGYSLTLAGEGQDRDEASAFLSQAFVLALFLIFMVLVAQFNSLPLPAIILISVVLSLIGVLFGLIVTGTPFGIIMTGLGVISLAGIVVNNAIVLIDFIGQLRVQGLSRIEAIVRAGTIRLRPVVLTALTTLLGLLPMAVGVSIDFFGPSVQVGGSSAEWWGPMAVAVVFGLTVATFLTLVVVPVLYSLFDDASVFMRRKLGIDVEDAPAQRPEAVREAA
jgi:multidrug efflux pump